MSPRDELRAACRAAGIKGYSDMTKDQMQRALKGRSQERRGQSSAKAVYDKWDGFESEVEAQGPKKSQGCQMGRLIEGLPEEGRLSLQRVLKQEAYSAASISRALEARGHSIRDRVLAEHRRGSCTCRAANR